MEEQNRKPVNDMRLNEKLAAYVREHSLADSGRLKEPDRMKALEDYCVAELRKGTADARVYEALNYIIVPEANLERADIGSEYCRKRHEYKQHHEREAGRTSDDYLKEMGENDYTKFFKQFGVLGEVYEIMRARGERIRTGGIFAYKLAENLSNAREESPNRGCIFEGPSEVDAVDRHLERVLSGKGFI